MKIVKRFDKLNTVKSVTEMDVKKLRQFVFKSNIYFIVTIIKTLNLLGD
jgi:hypothetical protein